MPRLRTQIKNKELVEKRRRQVIDAAVRLFLEKGFHATTIREICRASGVNRASIYDYFRNKPDILILIYEEMMKQRFWRQISPARNVRSDPRSLREFIRWIIHESFTRNREGILVLYRESDALDRKTLKHVLSIEADYIRYLTAELKKRSRWRGSPARLKILANVMVFLNAFFALRGWNLKGYDLGVVVDVIVDLMMNMFAPPAARSPQTATAESLSPADKRQGKSRWPSRR